MPCIHMLPDTEQTVICLDVETACFGVASISKQRLVLGMQLLWMAITVHYVQWAALDRKSHLSGENGIGVCGLGEHSGQDSGLHSGQHTGQRAGQHSGQGTTGGNASRKHAGQGCTSR